MSERKQNFKHNLSTPDKFKREFAHRTWADIDTRTPGPKRFFHANTCESELRTRYCYSILLFASQLSATILSATLLHSTLSATSTQLYSTILYSPLLFESLYPIAEAPKLLPETRSPARNQAACP